jgi:hypothetical protein
MFKILLSNQKIKQEGQHECIEKQHKKREDHTPIGFTRSLATHHGYCEEI